MSITVRLINPYKDGSCQSCGVAGQLYNTYEFRISSNDSGGVIARVCSRCLRKMLDGLEANHPLWKVG